LSFEEIHFPESFSFSKHTTTKNIISLRVRLCQVHRKAMQKKCIPLKWAAKKDRKLIEPTAKHSIPTQ